MRSLCPKLIVKSLLGTSTDVVLEAPYYVTSDLRARRARRSEIRKVTFRAVFGIFLKTGIIDWSKTFSIGLVPFSHRF